MKKLDLPPIPPEEPIDRLTIVKTIDGEEYHLDGAIEQIRVIEKSHLHFAGYIGIHFIDGSSYLIPPHRIKLLHFTVKGEEE